MEKDALRRTFEARGYTVTFVGTGAEARDYLNGKIDLTSVGFGGSETLNQIGLYDALRSHNAVVWHRNMFSDDVKHLASHAKVYVCSANAVAETGEIVNADGNGNRLAMTMYGPEQVYLVIGRNKLVPDLPAALWRVKHVATPKNARRFGSKLPCGNGEDCYECGSPNCMCRLVLTMYGAPGATPTELIFVDEDLGF